MLKAAFSARPISRCSVNSPPGEGIHPRFGLVTSFVPGMTAYPAIFSVWRSFRVRRGPDARLVSDSDDEATP
jgi:hypothetical protein